MNASEPLSALRLLRTPIVALVIGVGATGGAWFGSLWLEADARRSTDGLRVAVIEARNELARARAEVDTRDAYAVPFEVLRQQGILRGEDRLEWVEALRGFQRDRRLERLDYDLAPGRRLEGLHGYDLGPYALSATRIELSAGLLHEGDLLALFEMLRMRHLGMVVPRQCRLERTAAPATGSGLQARISLHCRLDWLSLRLREEHAERGQDAQ